MGQIRRRSVAVLKNIEGDPQIQRVFEIVTHKCEYVDEMAPLRDRNLEGRSDCVMHVEVGIRNAIKKDQLPKTVNPRLAAIGFHALMDGLIINWLLDPAYFSLGREAEKMMETYFRGLAAEPFAVKAPAQRKAKPAKKA